MGAVNKTAFTAVLGLTSACCAASSPPPSQFPTGEDALNRMKATYACANGIQGEGKIDHIGAEARIRGDVQLFAINPARVRADINSSFGALIYSLTSDGKNFLMLDNDKKQFLYGPAKACNLARMTKVTVPGHVLVWLLRGEAPLLVHEPGAPTLVWENGHYRIDIPSKHNASERVGLEVYEEDWDKPWQKQRVRVIEVTTTQAGTTLYETLLSDHKTAKTGAPYVDPDGLEPTVQPSGGACNVEIPRTIHITVPNTNDDVKFSYTTVMFNPPMLDGTFTQPIPGGVAKSFVDCPGD